MKVSLAAVIFCWLSGSTACLAAVAAGSPAAGFLLWKFLLSGYCGWIRPKPTCQPVLRLERQPVPESSAQRAYDYGEHRCLRPVAQGDVPSLSSAAE